jgi:cell division transport system ATP-binding protein
LIELRDVTKRYAGGGGAARHDALRGVTLGVARGQCLLVTGHSGAGKSTLLKLIAAIEMPTSGAVIVDGQPIARLPRRALPWLRRRLGLVFQDHRLLHDRSVFDNVALPLQLAGAEHAEIGRRVRAALDKVGLLGREKAMPVTLSGGEQQRVCIARAVVHRPAVVLADEPTGNLDADYARDIVQLLAAFRDVGVTMVIATHAPAAFAPLQPRAITLDHGVVVEAGT